MRTPESYERSLQEALDNVTLWDTRRDMVLQLVEHYDPNKITDALNAIDNEVEKEYDNAVRRAMFWQNKLDESLEYWASRESREPRA